MIPVARCQGLGLKIRRLTGIQSAWMLDATSKTGTHTHKCLQRIPISMIATLRERIFHRSWTVSMASEGLEIGSKK